VNWVAYFGIDIMADVRGFARGTAMRLPGAAREAPECEFSRDLPMP
jgi:hypothetical protein